MNEAETLDPRHSALLFFDMLKGYAYGPDLRTVLQEAKLQVAMCVRILSAARELGVPVFYAQADHRPDGRDRARALTDLDLAREEAPRPSLVGRADSQEGAAGSGFPSGPRPSLAGPRIVSGARAAEIIDEIGPQPGDYVVRKHRWSAFYQTELELSLRARGIDTLLLAGGSTEVGIASTAYSARDLDFNVVILRECARSGRGEAVSNFFLDQVFPRLARVRTVDETIQLLRADKLKQQAERPGQGLT
jgi:nicotinamidase-related amidase